MNKHKIGGTNSVVFSIIISATLLVVAVLSASSPLLLADASSGVFIVDSVSAAQTLPVSNVGTSSATLNGIVYPAGFATWHFFEYGTTSSLGNATTLQFAGSTPSFVTAAQGLVGLNSNTVYFYRLVAQNQFGTSYGSILSFVTQNNPIFGQVPVIETRLASFVYQNAAIINAGVNPIGFMTSAWFDYGTTTNLGQRTGFLTVGDSSTTQNFIGTLSGLVPNTTYFYRVTAQNQFGTSYGGILSFRTSASVATPTPSITPSATSTVVPSPTPSVEQDISCLTLTPSLSPASPDKGQDFTYSILYKNDCNSDFANVILKVTLPLETTFKSANLPYTAEANNFTFNLGNVAKGYSSNLEIKGTVNDSANNGDTIIFSSILNLNDSNGKFRSVVSTLSDTVSKDGEVAGLSTDISDALSDGGWWWILFIVLVLIVIFLIYILLSERRRRRIEYRRNITINNPPPPPSYR